MSWILKGLTGPLKDQIFPLKPGMTLGRQGADILINDLKVSSIHARISQTEDGKWILHDNNSKNGIRIGDERITNLPLRPGVVFYVSDYGFEVDQVAAKAKKPGKGQRYWYEVLSSLLKKNMDHFEDRVVRVTPLEPALVLEFVRGVQVNSRWVLGYGPRRIGPSSIDLPIWQPGAPPVCFEILPSADGIVFKTKHPDLVTLNGEKVDSRTLRVGDNIRIMDTIIEVDFEG